MVKELIKALKRKEAEVAAMEARIAHELHEELVELPAFYGFDSLPDFLKAVKKAVGGLTKKRRKIVRQKRKRAKVAPAVRAKVKQPAQKVRKKRAAAKKAAPAKIPPVPAAAEDAPLPSTTLS
jgi:hypothetical protein